MIEAGHSSEVLSRDAGGIVLADHSVGVGGVADDDGLDIALSVVVDSLAGFDENLAVVFKEVSTFHTWAAGLGTDEEVEVDVLEGNFKITGDDDVVEQWEGTVVEFCLYTLESVLSVGEIEQVQNDSLVGSEE